MKQQNYHHYEITENPFFSFLCARLWQQQAEEKKRPPSEDYAEISTVSVITQVISS